MSDAMTPPEPADQGHAADDYPAGPGRRQGRRSGHSRRGIAGVLLGVLAAATATSAYVGTSESTADVLAAAGTGNYSIGDSATTTPRDDDAASGGREDSGKAEADETGTESTGPSADSSTQPESDASPESDAASDVHPTDSTPAKSGARKSEPMKGIYNQNQMDHVKPFEDWLGDDLDHIMTFSSQNTWKNIENVPDVIAVYKGTKWADNLIISTNIVPCYPGSTDSIKRAATGEYNHHYVREAQTLVANGFSDVIIRPRSEFNGRWACGGIVPGGKWNQTIGTPAEFGRAWRHYVKSMRAVRGANFKFTWCPNNNEANFDDTKAAYPGNKYVDIIGVDAYDQAPYQPIASHEERWKEISNDEDGLEALAKFAHSRKKPISVDEWGLWDERTAKRNPGGDNPYYIEKMHAWMVKHKVRNQTLFNDPGPESFGDHRLHVVGGETLFPKAAAMYKKLFGAS